MKKKNTCVRFWELDSLRGIAIIFMVIYHALFMLNYFSIYAVNLKSFFSRFLALGAEILFFSLVGISLYISYNRDKEKKTEKELRNKFLARGIKIILWGMLITLFSSIFFPDYLVIFGVLQFIGLSIILGYYFLRYDWLNLLIGIITLISGYFIDMIPIGSMYLLVLGFPPPVYQSIDYFTLIPWFGLVLIGIYLGQKFYQDNIRILPIKDYSDNYFFKTLSYLGQHSLFIYLIHLPLTFFIILFIRNIFM